MTVAEVRDAQPRALRRHGDIEVRLVTTRIGAEVVDLDLSEELSGAELAGLREAVLEHKVLFFRAQHLDQDGQVAFAARFGALTGAHPTIPSLAQAPPVYDLDSLTGAPSDVWHTDVTFIEQPPDFSILRAVVIPEVGGDTLWASTVAAYKGLRPELRQLAEQLRAVHSNDYDYVKVDLSAFEHANDPVQVAYLRQFVATVFRTEHPVVRVHPETGEKALLLGAFAQRLVGYSSSESADLIRIFQAAVTKPENTLRWHWAPGDVVIWDNRSTQHYAAFDYGTSVHRRVQRVTTVGTVPIGADGSRSVALEGDATDYLSTRSARALAQREHPSFTPIKEEASREHRSR